MKRHHRLYPNHTGCSAMLVLLFLTGMAPAQELPPDAIARFHINNASYLADVGKYLEALEELNTAFDFCQSDGIKAEALSLKANLLSAFLDNPRAALDDYNRILQSFGGTPLYEAAIFQSGMLRYELGELSQARGFFERYLREFPTGPRATTAEFLIGQIAEGKRPEAPTRPEPSQNIKIALKEVDSVVLSSDYTLMMDGTPVGASIRLRADKLPNATAKVTGRSPINVDGRAYRGAMVVYAEGGRLRVVNDIPIEEYLYSVVGSEVPASWPLEALKAQAVAARTYAYYHVLHPRSPGRFDVYDDVRSQVYRGRPGEHPRVRQAVDATRGQVLTYQGNVLLAYYTSNNGGVMADPAFIFGTAIPYFRPNRDDLSAAEPLGQWNRRFAVQDVEEALRKSGYRVSGIRRITPVKVCPSGRLIELMIEHEKGQLKLNTRTQFRRAINEFVHPKTKPENMPEILMQIRISGEEIEMAGGGWGHGVGMSQYGGRAMAKNGSDYTRILATYYVGSAVRTLF